MTLEIVQIIQEFSTAGGAERVAWELARSMERAGIPNSVIASAFAPACGRSTAVRPVARWLSRIPTRGFLRHIGRLLVVPIFTLSATSVARSRRGAVLISHGDSFVGDILVVHAVNAENLAEKRRAGSWLWLLNPMHFWVSVRDRLMIGGLRYKRYVAVSPRVKHELEKNYKVPPDRIVVIPNGVDVERFKLDPQARNVTRRAFGIPPDGKLLTFVGHEFGRKGLAHVIAAMERLDEEFYLLVVGSDNDAPYRKMARRCKDRIFFAGERRDLETIYPAADALVFPTSYETFSLVCMEAMACGVPVFATRAGGIESYLEDGVNGYAIAQDGNTIADAIERVFRNPSHLERLKVGARQTALSYRWDEIASLYIALAQDVRNEKLTSSGRGRLVQNLIKHDQPPTV